MDVLRYQTRDTSDGNGQPVSRWCFEDLLHVPPGNIAPDVRVEPSESTFKAWYRRYLAVLGHLTLPGERVTEIRRRPLERRERPQPQNFNEGRLHHPSALYYSAISRVALRTATNKECLPRKFS